MTTGKPHLTEMQRQLELAADALPPDLGLRFRPMFGGAGVYAGDRIFAILLDAGLALKLPASAQADLLREPGATHLHESGQYVVVPPDLRADPERLASWMTRSVEHARSLPAAKSRRRQAAS